MDDELSAINLELSAARAAYQKAKVTFQLAADLHGVDLDIARSDGTAALKRANLMLSSAWERYQDALLAFAKYRGRHDA
jgi:hypothetical protein